MSISTITIKAQYSVNGILIGPKIQFTLPRIVHLNTMDKILDRAKEILRNKYLSSEFGKATIMEIIIKEDT